MYFALAYLLQPYVLVLILQGLALANLWRKRRETHARLLGLTVAYAVLIVLSLPAVSYLAFGSLEWQCPPLDRRPGDAAAIVVLGGGVLTPDAEPSEADLDSSSMYRCLQAARLYHQGQPCPVLVSGGKYPDSPGPPCADVMYVFLLRQGVKATDLIVENTSRTTHENAVESCKLLQQRHIRNIVLVTEATHLPRAIRCFRKQGVEVVASGCHYRAQGFEASVQAFLPGVEALGGCGNVTHEWLGLAWYWLRGRI
jgi:uncharacterized SAM-binding protein YcdF (DUF218 family)